MSTGKFSIKKQDSTCPVFRLLSCIVMFPPGLRQHDRLCRIPASLGQPCIQICQQFCPLLYACPFFLCPFPALLHFCQMFRRNRSLSCPLSFSCHWFSSRSIFCYSCQFAFSSGRTLSFSESASSVATSHFVRILDISTSDAANFITI